MTKTETIGVDTAKILREIKSRIDIIRTSQVRIDQCRTRLFVDVYTWTEAVIAGGQFKAVDAACRALGDTVKLSKTTLERYYSCGRLMRDNCWDPESVNPTSIEYLARHGKQLQQPELLKARSFIKQDKPPADIMRLVHKAKLKSGASSSSRARNIIKSGQANRTTLRMEMLALQTLARTVFKRKGIAVYVCDDAGDVLEQVGAGEPKA